MLAGKYVRSTLSHVSVQADLSVGLANMSLVLCLMLVCRLISVLAWQTCPEDYVSCKCAG